MRKTRKSVFTLLIHRWSRFASIDLKTLAEEKGSSIEGPQWSSFALKKPQNDEKQIIMDTPFNPVWFVFTTSKSAGALHWTWKVSANENPTQRKCWSFHFWLSGWKMSESYRRTTSKSSWMKIQAILTFITHRKRHNVVWEEEIALIVSLYAQTRRWCVSVVHYSEEWQNPPSVDIFATICSKNQSESICHPHPTNERLRENCFCSFVGLHSSSANQRSCSLSLFSKGLDSVENPR